MPSKDTDSSAGPSKAKWDARPESGDGRHCPKCTEDIGIWAIVRAGLPNRIRCPHCQVRVRYQGIRGLILALIVWTIVLGYLSNITADLLFPENVRLQVAAFGVLWFTAWVPIELATAHFLRRRCVLRTG